MEMFNGFPYLVTSIVSALHHVTLLPAEFSDAALLALAGAQIAANKLPTCLTLKRDAAVYFDVDGGADVSHEPPRGEWVVFGRLEPQIAFPSSVDLRSRQQWLARFVEKHSGPGGSMFGDLTKGGRGATPQELDDLAGLNDDGSPRGLTPCESCSDWRGVCLDPGETFRDQVMTVHCRCENHNRCARCGETLFGRRLNANFYDRGDGMIWHVPGFSGLSHRCDDVAPRSDLTDRTTVVELRKLKADTDAAID